MNYVFFLEKVTPSMGPCNGDFGGGLMDGQQVFNVIHIFASEGFLRKRILT